VTIHLSERVRFGIFELNVRTGELVSVEAEADGHSPKKVFLRDQPFQILRILVERRGGVVSREEIRSVLWPNDTIVDFDRSINVAIAILRKAVGDSAENAKYIETLPRRGYRLMIPVEWQDSPDPAPKVAEDIATSPSTQPIRGGGLTGTRISHYRVLEVLGGGGMGVVYKGEDLKLGRPVALKFLPEELARDPDSLKRFEREAQTASSLNHPNICTIFEVEEFEEQPIIVMELLEGETLRDRLAAPGSNKMALDQLLDIALQTSSGLAAAHAKGIVHRDVKPANIFLAHHGQVKILDFGLAKLASLEQEAEIISLDSEEISSAGSKQPLIQTGAETSNGFHTNLTRTGVAMGTANYMSPEQVRKEKLDARTDLFSFGLILYEMATGQRAFAGETAAVIHEAILNKTPVLLRESGATIPRGLGAVIAKALEKDRSRRYQSVAEMQLDLERLRREMRPGRRRLGRWFAVAASIIALAFGVWTYRDYRNRMILSADDTIIIADVNNQTSDPVFDDALKRALLISLEQTPYLNVLETDKVSENLRLLNLPVEAKVTPEIARQLCLRTNSKLIITSSIVDVGNRFRVELNAITCQSGQLIARVSEDVAGRNEVVHVLGISAALLRSELGEPAASRARFNTLLEQAASPSPDAIQQLEQGYRRHIAVDLPGAIQHYRHAVELDPDFGLAYAALGSASAALGQTPLAASALKKAYELRNRMTEPTRFRVEDLYYAEVTGEQEKALAVLLQWEETFQSDFLVHNNLSGALNALGQPDRAADEAREAARLLPTAWSYRIWMTRSIAADRLEEAKAVFDEALSRKFDTADMHEDRALVAFLQKDKHAMEEQLKWGQGKPFGDRLVFERSRVEAYYGQFAAARRSTAQAIVLADMTDTASGNPAFDNGEEALEEAEVGNLAQARRFAEKTLTNDPNRHVQLVLALAFAQMGDTGEAQKLTDTYNRNTPVGTQYYSLPTIRAAIKLHKNDAAGAVEILRPTVKYDLADPDGFSNLYPAYIRGLAYLQMGEGREAAAEFQKLLDHPGLVGDEVIGALSHLQLARAQKVMGNEAAARSSYEDFLRLWKNADSNIPIYKQAKLEYSLLRKKLE
jgi:serine/threonine protein kinase/DNA-binding winged helix-turn-helix (wHTH) protein/Flp pilus assembly protein TadD